MDFSHHIMHTIQHIIKGEQDIMTMMHQMFLFLTIRQLWRSIFNHHHGMWHAVTVGIIESEAEIEVINVLVCARFCLLICLFYFCIFICRFC